jgi:hypothetical protein
MCCIYSTIQLVSEHQGTLLCFMNQGSITLHNILYLPKTVTLI